MFPQLELLNLEVTQKCRWNCPQCHLAKNARDLDFEAAKKILLDAKFLGLKFVNISGGETLLYPKLLELVEFCAGEKILPNIAVSGAFFTAEYFKKLVAAGMYGIFVSLNGSTEKINSLTRDGFAEAVAALKIISGAKIFTAINWVMHFDNAEDFPAVVELAERNKIRAVYVLMYKRRDLDAFPNKSQIYQLSRYVKNYTGKVALLVDRCFSQMRAVMGDWILGNDNVGELRGCRAGLDLCAVNADGTFSPCRHIKIFEQSTSIQSYWQNSEALKKIRAADSRSNICTHCRFFKFCRPCMVNARHDAEFTAFDNFYCPFAKER